MEGDQKFTKIRCGEPRIISLQYKKSPKEELKRKVQYDLIENKPTIVITQEFKVRRSNVQYIVNLSTNLCDHKTKKGKKRHSKSKKETSVKKKKKTEISAIAGKDRIVPVCMRKKCSHDIRVKTQEIKLKRCRVHKCDQFTSPTSKSKRAVKQNHKETPRKSNHHKRQREICRQSNRTLLSPISMSPLSNEKLHDITYEDISDDNFQTNSEDELETLIKRTKERERNMVIQNIKCKAFKPIESPEKESIENEYFMDRTPKHCSNEMIEDNDTVFSSEMDVSIHSLATVVLATHSDAEAYSPTASPFVFGYSDEAFQETMYLHDTEELISETVNLQETNPERAKVEKYSPAIRYSEDRDMMYEDNTQHIQKSIKKELDIDDVNDQCFDLKEKLESDLRSENPDPSVNTNQLQRMSNMDDKIFVKPEIEDDYTSKSNCNNNTIKCSSSFTGYSNVDTFGDGFPIKQEIKLEPE